MKIQYEKPLLETMEAFSGAPLCGSPTGEGFSYGSGFPGLHDWDSVK